MKKMTYPAGSDAESGKKVPDRTRLIYNPHMTLSGIPPRVNNYVLGTRSGIDWIIDRYVTTDAVEATRSGIAGRLRAKRLGTAQNDNNCEHIWRATANTPPWAARDSNPEPAG
jgi:hypothetical protein